MTSPEYDKALSNLVKAVRASDKATREAVSGAAQSNALAGLAAMAQVEQHDAVEAYIKAVNDELEDEDGDGGDGGEGEDPTEVWDVGPMSDELGLWRYGMHGGGLIALTERNPVLMVVGANKWSTAAKNTPRLCQPGAEIRMAPGDYPHSRLTHTYDEDGTPDRTIVIRSEDPHNRARILPNPVDGSQTYYAEWAGGFDHHDIDFLGDDLSTIQTENPYSERWDGSHPGFRDLRFFNCNIVGGFDWKNDEGPRTKWGVLAYATGRSAYDRPGWVWKGGKVGGIYHEHGLGYFHNVQGDHLFEDVDVDGCGRTVLQFVARGTEGSGGWPEGKGNIVIRRVTARRFGLNDGAFGLTFKGRHRGKVLIDDCYMDAGGYEVHPKYQQNVVGCFSSHGKEGPTDEIEIRNSEFYMGGLYKGEGSFRRENVGVAQVFKFTMRENRFETFPGARECLRLDLDTIGVLDIDDSNTVIGDCFLGEQPFRDPEFTGKGYRDMLDALTRMGRLA